MRGFPGEEKGEGIESNESALRKQEEIDGLGEGSGE